MGVSLERTESGSPEFLCPHQGPGGSQAWGCAQSCLSPVHPRGAPSRSHCQYSPRGHIVVEIKKVKSEHASGRQFPMADCLLFPQDLGRSLRAGQAPGPGLRQGGVRSTFCKVQIVNLVRLWGPRGHCCTCAAGCVHKAGCRSDLAQGLQLQSCFGSVRRSLFAK